MKILYLGPARESMISFLQKDNEVIHEEAPLAKIPQVDFIISYGYTHIIPLPIIAHFKDRAINLHISYLPWNRGTYPNFWSFLENTPKGVTILYLAEKADRGDILFQKEISDQLEDTDTLRTSYAKLSFNVETLFFKNWDAIKKGRLKASKQIGGGSYHKDSELEEYKNYLTLGWDTPVKEIIKIGGHK